MKMIFPLMLSVVLIGCGLPGCKSVTQKSNIVSITERTIGIKVGQNAQTQTPELSLGFQSMTFLVVPTSTNEIHAPAVSGGIDLQQNGFSTDIIEDFSTGEAAVYEKPPVKKKTAVVLPKTVKKPK